MNNIYYVYEWYIEETGEVFHVGKGKLDRYKSIKGRNKYFLRIYKKYKCNSRIYADKLSEEEAYSLEIERIKQLKKINQAKTNFHVGGKGGDTFKYLPKEDLDDIKNKISKHDKHKWKDPIIREKMTNSIAESRKNPEVIRRISEGTKKGMYKPEVRRKHLDKIGKPVTFIHNNEIINFETKTQYIEYFKIKYDACSRIPEQILKNGIYNPSRITKKNKKFECLIGARAYINKDLAKSVETMGDECNPVE